MEIDTILYKNAQFYMENIISKYVILHTSLGELIVDCDQSSFKHLIGAQYSPSIKYLRMNSSDFFLKSFES